MAQPLVAIVGRPNVGKSTLFNRLVGQRVAIVQDTPGITRDRVYGECEWRGRTFRVVDTGGLGMGEAEPFHNEIREQAELAIEEADVILFVTDVNEGLSPIDRELADMLRRSGKPVLVVVNKADNEKRELSAPEFYELGLGEVFAVAAHQGRGVGDLLDTLVEALPAAVGAEETDEERIRLAIVGRPNVGKSSLLNAIVGDERSIVSEVPGTTRDAVDVPFELGDQQFLLVDTAGIRRPGKVQGSVEFYMVLRAERALERADVAILVIDGASGLMDGDKRVAGLASEKGRGCVVFVNKWDLVRGISVKEFWAEVRRQMAFLEYAPAVFGSALKGQGVRELLDAAADVANNHAMRISTGELNRVLREAVERRPYTARGRELKLLYATQVAVKPPTFVLFVNDPKLVHFSYLRYLQNQLRAAFGFQGTPLRLQVRKRTQSGDEEEERYLAAIGAIPGKRKNRSVRED
jgi:GTP-binding protein